MAEKKWLRIEEVALLVGSSTLSINMWYKWKRENPNHEMAKLLPNYKIGKVGSPRTRCWSQDDIYRILEFKSHITTGRNGFMGDVSQRYVKKKEGKSNGKKKSTRNGRATKRST